MKEEHQSFLDQVKKEADDGQARIREEMQAQTLKASQTMKTALSALTSDKD